MILLYMFMLTIIVMWVIGLQGCMVDLVGILSDIVSSADKLQIIIQTYKGSMIKTLCMINLILFILCSGPQSQKRVAKIDEIQINLSMNQTLAVVQKIDQHQNLAFMVNVQQQGEQSAFGQFEVSLENAEKDRVACSFKYSNNLCVLQKCTQSVSINVKCLKQKCSTKLALSQRLLYHLEGQNSHKGKMLTVPGQIYKIEKGSTRSIIQINLQKLQDRLLDSDVKIYSNVHIFPLSQVEELDNNNVIFGVKPIINNNDQYFYIQGDQAQKNKELRFSMITHFDVLKERVSIVDFIQTFGRHSNNTYRYLGQLTKNIEVKARVFAPKENKNLPFTITLKGNNAPNDNLTTISTLQLSPIQFNGHRFHDIIFITTKSRHQKFKYIYVEVGISKVQDRAIFVEIGVSDVFTSDIAISNHVYFATSTNEELHFAVSPQVKYEIIGLDKQIEIKTLQKADEKYALNTPSCSLHKGCQIIVKAQKQCQSCSFTFDLQKQDIKNSIIYYQVKDDQIQAKIDLQEELYFKYQLQAFNMSQIVVNSANVIVYAQFQNYQQCKIPSAACHQFTLTQHSPIVVRNEDKIAQNLIVKVVGLQKTSFKLRFISEINGLQVKLGQKFSYLFDNHQSEINVKFMLSDETFKQLGQHVYFNLIAPIRSLLLKIKNSQGSELSSIDGYVQFPKKMIKSKQFDLTITKIDQTFVNKYIHMTLLVTTTDYGVKLDSTSIHYEKYLPKAEKKFIIEYQPSQENSINIYTENLERTRSTMKLTIRDLNLDDVEEQNKPFIEKLLERDIEVIDLALQLQNLDICQEINCQLQISIKSQSDKQLQQTITLLHGQSVISLDQTIWNSFEINDLSVTNHFFYVPRDFNKTVTILFSTEDRSLYIDYILHNTKKNLNPQSWPWNRQASHNTNDVLSHLTGFQQFKITVDDLKKCWPDCVVLVSLHQAHQEKAKRESELIRVYKILVSSTIIEVPQDLKFHVTMKTSEENAMFIDIKNFISAQQLTFFTDYKVGRARITATLVNKGQDYKIEADNKDFVFQQVQTNLPFDLITSALTKHQLKAEQTLLKINIFALSNLKMYFEFTSLIKSLYRLNIDDLQVCSLKVGEEIWYEFVPERDFSIKLYRAKGFPLFKIIKCSEFGYVDCLTSHQKAIAAQVQLKLKQNERTKQQSKNDTTQAIQIINQGLNTSTIKQLQVFVDKNYEYSSQSCQQCIFFIWVFGYAQDVQLSINIRSSSSEIQLKEMATLNDRLTSINSHRKYLINTEPQLTTIVSFRIMEGSCQLQISDNENILHNGNYSSQKNGYEDITIQGLGFASQTNDDEDNPLAELSDIPSAVLQGRKIQNQQHILRHLHVKITSTTPQPVEYLVSYSIGFSGIYLQDGSLSQKHMIPNVPHTLYYHNTQKNSHPYLSLSSTADPGHSPQQSANEFQARFFYYPDASNRAKKEEFRPEMPPKKNANLMGQMLTHVYELPAIYQLYEIEIYSKNYIKLTASVNHKQVVYLPIGFEYLIKLHAKEAIWLVIDRPDVEYLELTIKKCDESIPNLMYTNDVKEFQNGIYETREDLVNGYEKRLIKSKKGSKTIHLKITAEDEAQSLFTITVVPQEDPSSVKTQKVRPGNNGLLNYRALDSNKVRIQFTPLICENKDCSILGARYYLLLAPNISNIYSEMYCAGNYFVMKYKQKSEIQQSRVIALLPENYDKDSNTYRYQLTLKDEQEYVGVKAMYNENSRVHEVVYLPTEVTTLWRQVSRVPVMVVMVLGAALVVLIAMVVVVSTKLARKGYRPIAESQ